jgi:hypothetical protein
MNISLKNIFSVIEQILNETHGFHEVLGKKSPNFSKSSFKKYSNVYKKAKIESPKYLLQNTFES